MPKNIKIVAFIVCMILAGLAGYFMWTEPFWGWWPMWIQSSVWIGFVLLTWNRYSKIANNGKYLIASTISGLLLSAAFPPSFATPLIFIGFVPLLWVEHQIFKEHQLQKWAVWKYAFHSFYLWNVITTFWVVNTALVAGLIANILNAIIMATVIMLFHWAKKYVVKKWHLLMFAAFWISFEYIHLFWDISWPWLTLGNTFAQYPGMIQWYEWTGVFGGSLWILIVNYWLFSKAPRLSKLVRDRDWMSLLKSVLIFIGPAIIIPIIVSQIIYVSRYDSSNTTIEVAIVQPNFEPHYQKFDVADETVRDRFLSLSDSIITADTRLLIYPETSFGYIHLNNLEKDKYIRPLKAFLEDKKQLSIVSGAASYRSFRAGDVLPETARKQGNGYYDIQNSAIFLDSEVDTTAVYFKSKLVPGAEFFPFKKLLPFIKPIVEKLGGSMGHAKQKERSVFSNEFASIAPVICYESIYGEYVGEYIQKGADVIAVVTNDGWWDDTPGHKQHLLFARLRAIEHRRPVVRSANTGTSAFIDQLGKITHPTKYEVATAIRGDVSPNNKMTIYTNMGDLIARIAIFLAAAMMLFSISQWLIKRKELNH